VFALLTKFAVCSGGAMKPAAFDYVRAETADEVLSGLGQEGGNARVLAGGQSLMDAQHAPRQAEAPDRHHAPEGACQIEPARRAPSSRRRRAPAELLAWRVSPKRCRSWRSRCMGRARARPAAAAPSAARSHMPIPSAEMPLALVALGGEVHLRSARRRGALRKGVFLPA